MCLAILIKRDNRVRLMMSDEKNKNIRVPKNIRGISNRSKCEEWSPTKDIQTIKIQLISTDEVAMGR